MELAFDLAADVQQFEAEFFCDDAIILADTDIGITEKSAAPSYEDEYEITPTLHTQTLATNGKLMESDVTVRAIPYFEVSNTANGVTVTIA